MVILILVLRVHRYTRLGAAGNLGVSTGSIIYRVYKDMFHSQKWQFLLPLLMLPLFMLALLRTELRWRECTSDEGRVYFNYLLYLSYEIRQHHNLELRDDLVPPRPLGATIAKC